MVLAYYGRHVPLEVLRVECGVSRDGSKASGIARAARAHGMEARGSQGNRGARRDSVPAIVFWNFNHFVVLEGFRDGRAWLNDRHAGGAASARRNSTRPLPASCSRSSRTGLQARGPSAVGGAARCAIILEGLKASVATAIALGSRSCCRASRSRGSSASSSTTCSSPRRTISRCRSSRLVSRAA
jgi:hypothetical protein